MKRLFPLLSIILFFSIIILAFYFWYPQFGTYQKTQEKYEETEEMVRTSEEILEKLQENQRELEKYQDIISNIKVAYPSESLILDLHLFLRRIPQRHGLSLQNITIEQDGRRANINLSLIGNYSSFTSFLNFLNRNYKIFQIGDISFSPFFEEEEEIWNFEVNLSTYHSSMMQTTRE